jgi:tRNA dimethylallyltransferase
VQIGIDVASAALDARIADRVSALWSAGLVAETRDLVSAGLREGRTASRALGYQQVLAFLAGECGEQEAHDETIRATRRFVRRQRTWFRRDPRSTCLDGLDPDLTGLALRAVHAERAGAP